MRISESKKPTRFSICITSPFRIFMWRFNRRRGVFMVWFTWLTIVLLAETIEE